ncbi:MAG: hypothetical protein A2133_04965 [Actinobacteria bacterium RBG_16_64_13]|nr:MAG: hypothetical protein A2133_04965 [Actinobacteria bacterium RBG_16_64_13]
MRANFGTPYDVDALKLIDDLGDWGLLVRAVVVTHFRGPALGMGLQGATRPATRPPRQPWRA